MFCSKTTSTTRAGATAGGAMPLPAALRVNSSRNILPVSVAPSRWN
jgi:hypothetical protein